MEDEKASYVLEDAGVDRGSQAMRPVLVSPERAKNESLLRVVRAHPQTLVLLTQTNVLAFGGMQDCPYFVQQPGKARWILSEGEDRRSAGLWIWGLFEEPLYPFLLLQMQNLEIVRIS